MLNKRVHWLQHVPFEGLGYLSAILADMLCTVSVTKLYDDEILPSVNDFDLLIVMGGPMSVDDEVDYPWLAHEKKFIKAALTESKAILGICLGAQLLAEVLGANVKPNAQKEIGWWNVYMNDSVSEALKDIFPPVLKTFHWHGDTFDLPVQAIRLQHSDACMNQSFVYQQNIIGLQYHIEMQPETIDALCLHCADEINEAPYIQTVPKMKAYALHDNHLVARKLLMYLLFA